MANESALTTTGFFVLRTPLLAVDELHAWSAGLASAGALGDGATLETALVRDRQRLRERLRAIVERPEVREALFVASPSLDESLSFWLQQPDSERGQKVERTLVRYVSRMAARPTPFGLFAGVSLGAVGDTTRLDLDARATYRRHTSLDTDYVSALCDRLARDAELRRACIWRVNTSLYRAAGQIRYIELHLRERRRAYELAAAELTPELETVLLRARDGARLDELARALVDDDVTADEASEYIDQLTDAQLLVPDLQLPITGDEPIDDLLRQLHAADHPLATAIHDRLREIKSALRSLDESPVGAEPARYRAIAERLKELPATIDPSRLFHVVLLKPAHAVTLGKEPQREILRAVSLLHRLSLRDGMDEALARFRRAFAKRYDKRRMPLAEVLDEELGIGFDVSASPSAETAPLLDWMQVAQDDGGVMQVNRAHFRALLPRLDEALRTHASEVVLDARTLDQLAEAETARTIMPDGVAVTASIAAASIDALDAGDFLIHVMGARGPSGVHAFGRFGHADAALAARIRDQLQREAQARAPALVAEIAHLPAGDGRNTFVHPGYHDWEIPFAGRSGSASERQIPIADLEVSVAGDHVVIHSRQHQREVIPRLTTSHNFMLKSNLALYRFLCAVQRQHAPRLVFDWGALEAAPFLPRIRVGKIVLALARWRIPAEALRELDQPIAAASFRAAQRLREARRLPRWVGLVDSDNVLPVDFDNILSIETFVQLVRSRKEVVLTELFGFADAIARGPEGRFVHEMIVPLIARREGTAQPDPTPPSRAVAARASIIQRSFVPGSEWLYAKIFTGHTSANVVLREVVAPTIDAALASGAAESWFFVRNEDPDWHLRLRLRGDPRRLHGEVAPALAAAIQIAIARGLVWKLQIDTYEREVERYGGDIGIALSERLFAADSDAVLAAIQGLDGPDAKDLASRLTLLGLDRLLDDVGLTLPGKHALVSGCASGLGRELVVDARVARELGATFRRERTALEELLERAPPSLAAPFVRRAQALRPIVAELQSAERSGALDRPLLQLAESYLHMHVNRMLEARSRAQEFVLYSLLARLYKGRLSRDE